MACFSSSRVLLSRGLLQPIRKGLQSGFALHPPTNTVGMSFVWLRSFSSRKFSRNVEFFTPSIKPLPPPNKNKCVASALSVEDRPLTLLLCWLMSKDKHVRKYVQFYTDMGMDVLKIRVSLFDLLRPKKGSQVVADQVLEFLHTNPTHNPLLVHGFSVGAYVFNEIMVKVADDMKLHGHLLNRFVGQIWDSGVDLEGIPVGVSRAFTDNKVIQMSIRKYLEWYLRAHHETATVHYQKAKQKMHECFLGVPGLFLFSKMDPVSTPEMNSNVYKKWEAKGIPVFTRCFDESRHVSHYMKHQKIYKEEVLAFIEYIGLIEGAKLRSAGI